MLSFKIQNWKMLRSHNTHLLITWKERPLLTLRTHRYFRTGTYDGGSDTLRSITHKRFCGLGLSVQWRGNAPKEIVFGGDSEYIIWPKSRRAWIRVRGGYGQWREVA